MEMKVKKTQDFELTGTGAAPAWEQADWQPLTRVNGQSAYRSRCKLLYSDTGLYFLFDCQDRKLTCTKAQDFDDIYTEDVVEIFLWPNEEQHLYFEYEISPLGVELPILVPNYNGRFMGWRPWHYEGPRVIRRATAVTGGSKQPMASVDGWTAEFLIPFALLAGLGNNPPASGSAWRANMYRIDYDERVSQWAWCKDSGTNFHDFRRFGTILFE